MSTNSYPPKGTNSTRFNPQLEHFDMICGQTMRENKMLKLQVVVLVFIVAVLSIGIVFFLTKRTQIIPALVTMNDFGQTQYIGEVSQNNYQNFSVPEVALTYQVDYKQTTRTLQGLVVGETRQRAVVTIKTLNPTDEDIQDNPLGIYITDFDIKDIR